MSEWYGNREKEIRLFICHPIYCAVERVQVMSLPRFYGLPQA